MPCKNSERMAAMMSEGPEDDFAISYTISPHRGGYGEVFQITYNLDRDEPIFRYQHGSSLSDSHRPLRVGAHKIFDSFNHVEKSISTSEYESFAEALNSLVLPVRAEPTGGFDGVDYFLKIESLMTSVEYRWWLDIPKEWDAQLTPIIKRLTKYSEVEQVSAGNPLDAQ